MMDHCLTWVRKLMERLNTLLFRLSRHAFSSCHGNQLAHYTSAASTKEVTSNASTRGLHQPVMLREVLDILNPQPGKVFVDMTFGAGGHSQALLDREPQVKVYGLDRDPLAYKLGCKIAKQRSGLVALLGCFSESLDLLQQHGVQEGSVDGVLFDAGASSMQFDSAERGFSISQDGPLDMRMDAERFPDQPTAADIINHLDEAGLYQILRKYGEEKHARKIARAIVDSRYAFGHISTTGQFANVVLGAVGSESRKDRLFRTAHVATKTFQALRIFVNNELNELHNGLEIAHRLLKPGGLCVALSFHSLEDRIVKRHFHGIDIDAKHNMKVTEIHRSPSTIYTHSDIEKYTKQKWEPLVRKVIEPSEEELQNNPRSRSAKLRAAKKLCI